MHAYVNPDEKRAGKFGGEWGAKADGYGLVRFNVKNRTITMECWPRGEDVTRDNAPQYAGWPITITQEDNYTRNAVAFLPTLKFTNATNPVVQVIDESSDEIVYTLRIKGNSFRPKVFRKGSYTIKVGHDKLDKTFTGVKSLGKEVSEEKIISL